MPLLERYGLSLYYEDSGSGYPVLLLAPGSFQSSIDWWHEEYRETDPTSYLANDFRLIAMDQRNAGRSRALITAADGWHNFTEDHIALLDHLGIERVARASINKSDFGIKGSALEPNVGELIQIVVDVELHDR